MQPLTAPGTSIAPRLETATTISAYFCPRPTVPPSALPSTQLILLGRNLVEFFEHVADFRIGHETVPHQAGPVVFDHDCDRRLIQAHVDGRDPIRALIHCVARAVDVPHL